MDYRRLFSLLLFIIIVIIAIFKGEELYSSLVNVKIGWAIAGLFFYFCNYLFRSLRICTISNHRVKLWPEAIRTSMLHGFMSYMMPVRTGELSLPVLLKSESGIKIVEGTKILIQARLLDLLALGILSLVAATIGVSDLSFRIRIIWMSVSGLMIFSCWIVIMANKFIESLPPFISRLSFLTNLPLPKSIEIIQSLWIWIMIGGCIFCTIHAIGLSLSFWEIWILIAIHLPFQLLPLQGIANTGNHEGSWIVGLTFLGVAAKDALHYSIVSHAVLFLYVILMALPAILMQRMQNVNSQSM